MPQGPKFPRHRVVTRKISGAGGRSVLGKRERERAYLNQTIEKLKSQSLCN